jgi:hypothetical protein
MLLVVGTVVVLVGLGFVFPAIAQLRDTGVLPAVGVGLLLVGLMLTFAGGGAMLYGTRRLRA